MTSKRLTAQRGTEPIARGRVRILLHPGEPPPLGTCVWRQRIASRLDAKEDVLDQLTSELLDRGWVAGTDRSWLQLCLDEALTNAILHGNEGDPGLVVDIGLFHDPPRRTWTVTVLDQGCGFAVSDVPDPNDAAAPLREHGRGVLLMRQWCELSYYLGGALAVLAKRCARNRQGVKP